MTEAQKFFLACCRDNDEETFFRAPEDWYVDRTELRMQAFVADYYRKHRKMPSDTLVTSHYKKKFDAKDYDGETGHYLAELGNRFIRVRIGERVPHVMKHLSGDPKKTLSDLKEFVNNLDIGSDGTRDVRYSGATRERFEEYKARKGVGGIKYLRTGDELLDDILIGYDRGDLITIGGRAGTGKTWFLIYLVMMLEQVLEEEHGPVLVFSGEMSAEQLLERMDSMRFKLPYNKFIRGELKPREEARYERGLKAYESKESPIIIIDDAYTLNDVEVKLLAYRPAMVFIDGSYLLEPTRTEGYEKTTFITRNLKRIAKQHRTPILNTTQLRKGTGTKANDNFVEAQDEFYHGSYVQDSDVAISSFINNDLIYRSEVGYTIAKGRRTGGRKFFYRNDLEAMEFMVKPDPDELPEDADFDDDELPIS